MQFIHLMVEAALVCGIVGLYWAWHKAHSAHLQTKYELDLAQQRYQDQQTLAVDKEKALKQMVEALKSEFSALAFKQLQAQGADLSKQNSDRLDLTLKPLKDQLTRLQQLVHDADTSRTNLGKRLDEKVGAIDLIAKELATSANALKSNNRVQGVVGEDILAEHLRQVGLVEGQGFVLQEGTGSSRPDAQVCDAQGRWLVIDSKVSLTAYMDYLNAKDDATRSERLKAHAQSVGLKIDELVRRNYPQELGRAYPDRQYLPLTAMFMPFAAPLEAALQAQPALLQRALENNVVLITPLTLGAYLRLVKLGWQRDLEVRNQLSIVAAAQVLLERVNTFLLNFEAVGTALNEAQDQYKAAESLLVDAPGRHSIAKGVQKLVDLGAKLEPRKSKPKGIAHCLQADLESDVTAAEVAT